MLIDRRSFDIIQRQKGVAIRRHTCVIQSRDVWVIQGRENLALAGRSLDEIGAMSEAVWQFDRDRAVDELVGSFSKPDRCLAAGGELAHKPIHADGRARLLVSAQSSCDESESDGLSFGSVARKSSLSGVAATSMARRRGLKVSNSGPSESTQVARSTAAVQTHHRAGGSGPPTTARSSAHVYHGAVIRRAAPSSAQSRRPARRARARR